MLKCRQSLTGAYLGGRIQSIVVRVHSIDIPERFLSGDYEEDAAFREDFQRWVRDLWDAKDALLDELQGPYKASGMVDLPPKRR